MDKRKSPVTIHLYDALKASVKHVADSEGHTVSTWIKRKLESDPTVRVVLKQIGGSGAKQ
jgi:hypothetical protein